MATWKRNTTKDNLYSIPTFNGPNRWEWSGVAGSLWNKSWPYQLAVLYVEDNAADYAAWEANRSEDGTDEPPPSKTKYSAWDTFTLPVPPESWLSSTPFAINVQATQGGVVEQHGGAPFKQIVFSGSFGVLADRDTATASANPIGGSILNGLLPGTMAAVTNLAKSVSSLFGDDDTSSSPYNIQTTVEKHSTGYAQFLALQAFLEGYVGKKKTANGENFRLAVIVWKELAAYLVTPLRFDVQRSVQSPLEYRYTLQFQAWRRIDPLDIDRAGFRAKSVYTYKYTPNFLSGVLNAIAKGMLIVAQAMKVITAVVGDAQRIMEAIRSVALLVKQIVGVAKALIDLPKAILAVLKEGIIQAWDILKSAFDVFTDPKTVADVQQISVEVANIKAGTAQSSPTLASVLAGSNPEILAAIPVDRIPLNRAQKALVEAEVRRVQNLTSQDFRDIAQALNECAAKYADAVGMGSPTFDRLWHRTGGVKVRDAQPRDFEILDAITGTAKAIGSLAAYRKNRGPKLMEYVAGAANSAGIDVRVPKSKLAVPVPYGFSVERIAQEYLGDVSRWIEIVELNHLQAPYIDEDGVTTPLLSNGSGSAIVIDRPLKPGQHISLSSDSVIIADARKVTSVAQAGDRWVISLDGAADLSKFTTAGNARVHYFRPGTTNSTQIIYIPSSGTPDPNALAYAPASSDLEAMLRAGNVDGKLDESGDIVITNEGDWPYVYGIAGIGQWVRIALTTPRGSMGLHPTFGLPEGVGESNADASIEDFAADVKAALAQNSAITGLRSINAARSGPVTRLAIEVGVNGSDAPLPLSFDVPL